MKIEKGDGGIRIEVSDDGLGMDAEALRLLQDQIFDRAPCRSVGLPNVYRRIRLVYGEAASISVESELECGTQVRLFLPLRLA